jgi:hypothetical protein
MRHLVRAFVFNVAVLFALFYSIALLGAFRTGEFGHWMTLFLNGDVFFLIAASAIGAASVTGLVAIGAKASSSRKKQDQHQTEKSDQSL